MTIWKDVPVGESVEAMISQLGADPRLRDVVLGVARRGPVERCGDEDHPLGLAAESGGEAAVYVHRGKLAIGLNPEAAQRVRERHGFAVDARRSGTHYVQVYGDQVAATSAKQVVEELLVQAFTRSSSADRWERPAVVPPRAAGRSPRKPAAPREPRTPAAVREPRKPATVCSVHFVELSVTGVCPMDPDCDGAAV